MVLWTKKQCPYIWHASTYLAWMVEARSNRVTFFFVNNGFDGQQLEEIKGATNVCKDLRVLYCLQRNAYLINTISQ